MYLGVGSAVIWLSLACSLGANAHDRWADGDPVPVWVKEQCCGISDAHHLRPDQVHLTPDGYRVDGYAGLISESHLTPSPDGEWWIFYRNYPGGSQSAVYCFFGPIQGS
jgi:hypothetical protein